MYLRRRRTSELKEALAKKSSKGRSCPACSTTMEFVENGKDRATYFCPRCRETVTFTSAPDLPNKPPKKVGSAISLRDQTRSRRTNAPKEVDVTVTDELKLEQIRACMEEKNILMFAYNNHDTGFSSRSVEPYKITVDKVGDIVLYAFDIDAGSIRIFKLQKMKALEKQEYGFSPRWPIEDKLHGTPGNKEKP